MAVSAARDAYEREADRIAEVVTGGEDSARSTETDGTVRRGGVQLAHQSSRERRGDGSGSDRSAGEATLRRDGTSTRTRSLDPAIEAKVDSLQGGGRALSPAVRSFFEPRFGHDLSDARVHTGSVADDAARSLGAKAFTVGRDIAFRSDEYRPGTNDGRRLLAHELTHVLQQRGEGSERAGQIESRVQRQRDDGDPQTAEELIDAHTAWWNLDEEGLARVLLNEYLLAGDVQMTHKVLDAVSGRNVDDVSRHIIEQASDDQLLTIAGNKPGRDLLRRMVRALQAGPSLFEDEENVSRPMDAVTEAQPAAESEERDEPAADEEEQIDVKVVTFKEGAQDPVVPEQYHGHTALVVGGYVYSYDGGGWKCGQTESEYQQENDHRGAWVQVLDVPEADARQLQRELNSACESGWYGVRGVCTSNSARHLQTLLDDVDSTWSPKRFKKRLDASGHVERTYEWAEGGETVGKERREERGASSDEPSGTETATESSHIEMLDLGSTTLTVTVHTVTPGDTLWDIARKYDVPGGWEAIYEENRDVIGDDPDLIHPGQRLVIPRRR